MWLCGQTMVPVCSVVLLSEAAACAELCEGDQREETNTQRQSVLPTEQRWPDPAVLRQRGQSQAAHAAGGREVCAESRDTCS